MNIISNAYKEGQDNPDVEYDNSNAKKDEIRLNVSIDNLNFLKTKKKNTIIVVQQICAKSGKLLKVFPNRLSAGKWVVEHVLKRPNKNPLSICGNMEMCMRAGWKAYGYYWKMVEPSPDDVNTIEKKVFYYKGNTKGYYNSIVEAANDLSITPKNLGQHLRNGKIKKFKKNGYSIWLQHANMKAQTLDFNSLDDMKKHFTISNRVCKTIIKYGFNNYTVNLNLAKRHENS